MFRLGIIIGGAIGYVMGAKAGRQRYEQLMQQAKQWRESPQGQQVTAKASEVAAQVTEKVKERTGGGGSAGGTSPSSTSSTSSTSSVSSQGAAGGPATEQSTAYDAYDPVNRAPGGGI